ncbi:amidohydrolase family protein [Granulicella arctica]|uniref:amidohydrolase family protein n=1 Tax=Granulicella arctica TaxID=940613 RepID=UPI0021DF4EA2|nr:amidohydrolase family protein [Granulicella arctica]
MRSFVIPQQSEGICFSSRLISIGHAAAVALLLVTPVSLHAQARMVDTTPGSAAIAITNGKLLTITHGVIEHGTIVLQGGKIVAIGAASSVKIPSGATKIDATGMTVYPGLIDSETNLGLVEIESDRVNSDLVETSEEIYPQMHVYDAFHAETERIPIDRFNGVTNAIVAPESSDTMPGQDIFIQLAGRDRDTMIVTKDVALAMNFGQEPKRGGRGGEGGAGRGFPSTRMGEISQLRQALLDAQEYMVKKAEVAKKPASAKADETESTGRKGGGPTGKFDLRNEALLPYLRGERPVILGAYEGHDVEVAMALAQEFHLKVVLNHVTHSQDVLDKIAAYKVPVIFGPIYDFPDANERYDAVYSMPAELQKRGVKIAFASYSVEFNRNLPYAAGFAVAYGLPYDEALKALTINPAEMWGMADKLGSLDIGKTANVVIANGDPLDVRTSVKQVYIDGVAIPMETRQTRLRDEYMPKK